MIRTYYILLLGMLFTSTNAQEIRNTKEFFPYLDSSNTKLLQTIKITDQDTVVLVYHQYEFITDGKKQYLISSTYDTDSSLTTVLKEEITKKGLKFVVGLNIEYDKLGNSHNYVVKGSKKVTFPFKPLDKMDNWKTTVRNTFDNKIVVRSKIEFTGIETVYLNGEELIFLNFKRTVRMKYKHEYKRSKDFYEYTWSFAIGQGMYRYSRFGRVSFEGLVIKSE